jgi:chromosome segregation ATPase
LSDKESELAKMMGELNETSTLADSQKIEIIALKTQVEALKERLDGAGFELKTLEDRRDAERIELKASTRELTEERGRVEKLGRRVGELEQQLLVESKEAEILGQRAQDLENRLTEQSRLLNQSEFELKHLRQEMESARKVESDLRTAIIELEGRSSSATQNLRTENTQLQAALTHAKDERDRFARDLGSIKRETEENWASERVENALLRERINDVAAEVARLASALEGPDSPIDNLLAAETSSGSSSSVAPAVSTAKVQLTEPPDNGNLADRIRALQTHASRLSRRDPKTRN